MADQYPADAASLFRTPAHEQLEALLADYRERIGDDYDGYLNHCRRMLGFCHALHPDLTADEGEKLAIAAAFHDIGLWTDDTLDYLPPSSALAEMYLRLVGKADWVDEICLMVTEHHRLRPVTETPYPLVEVFRQADLVDFSLGAYRAGLPRALIDAAKQQYPNAGFHAMLARRSLRWLRRHPLRPAPMMKW